MAKRIPREMTLEEFDSWSKSTKQVKRIAAAADEVGGPRLSLVPLPDQDLAWPTDFLPLTPPREGEGGDPAVAPENPPRDGEGAEARSLSGGQASTGSEHGGGGSPTSANPTNQPITATPFDGIPLESSRNRLAGWGVERQRLFLTVLAETGQVHLASAAARLSVRSAQALRVRSPAFNAGWRMAEQLGAGRLSPIAFDRAINGRIEQVYHEGTLIAERRVPSDKMLMWLLARLDPARFALPWEQRGDADPQARAAGGFQAMLDGLTDTPS